MSRTARSCPLSNTLSMLKASKSGPCQLIPRQRLHQNPHPAPLESGVNIRQRGGMTLRAELLV